MATAMKVILIIALLTCFTINQAYPVFPYGFYGYQSPYSMPFYPYAVPPVRQSYNMATPPVRQSYNMAAQPVRQSYNMAAAVPVRQPIGFIQRSYGGFMRNFVNYDDPTDKISNVRKSPQDFYLPEMPGPQEIQEVQQYREISDERNLNNFHEDYRQIMMRSGEPQIQTLSMAASEERIASASASKATKEDIDESIANIKQRNFQDTSTADDGANFKEIRGNTLEMEEEYEKKKVRDTEWDQSDYDNDYWENTKDMDEIKDFEFNKKSSQTPIDLRVYTYVNDLLAAKDARINPPKTGNTEREELTIPQLNYHGDTNVNNILMARNTPINPDAEFIPPSSKYSAPIHVHYGYEIDEDNNNPVDLTRDIEVNYILPAKGTPVNPNAEMIQFSYKGNNDINRDHGEYLGDTYVNEIFKKHGAPKNPNAEILIKTKPKQQGQYSGDTYVNEILEEKRTPMNPDAEIFTTAEVIEFVPLGAEEFEFEHDLTGDTNVNNIAEATGVQKNPLAEEFEAGSAKQQIASSRK